MRRRQEEAHSAQTPSVGIVIIKPVPALEELEGRHTGKYVKTYDMKP